MKDGRKEGRKEGRRETGRAFEPFCVHKDDRGVVLVIFQIPGADPDTLYEEEMKEGCV